MRWQRPVDLALGLLDLVRVGHALGRLGHGLQAATGGQLQRFHDHAATQVGQAVVQHRCGVGGRDGGFFDQQHVARIQPCVHLHDGDAGFGIARLDGAVDGRSATPAGQQAGVDIEATFGGHIQHPLGQDETVGGHHHHIGLGSQQRIAGGGSVFGVFAVQPQAAGLGHGNAVVQRALLDGGGLQLHATACRAVGLRQHQWHGEPRRQQARQGHAGKFGGSGKNHSHGKSLAIRLSRATARAGWWNKGRQE